LDLKTNFAAETWQEAADAGRRTPTGPFDTLRRSVLKVVNFSTRNSRIQAGAAGQHRRLRSAAFDHFCFLSRLTHGVGLIFLFIYSRLKSEDASP